LRKIYVFDTSLRDGEQSPGVNLDRDEKVEIALQLERLGVDLIEAGFAAASPGDAASVQAVAKAVKNATVVSLSRAVERDIDLAWEALRHAEDPCLHLFLATSPIHREYKLRMSKEQVLENADKAIRYAKRYFSKIEFSPEDGGRTEMDYLCQVTEMAIAAGATTINIPDTVGYLTPIEYGNIFRTLKNKVYGIEKIRLSCHCHDDLGMATANALAAIEGGADQVEGTMNGIGERAGNTALEEVALALETRKDYYNATTSLRLTETYSTSRLVSRLTGMVVPGNKAIVGANAFAHESGIHQDGMLKEKTTYEILRPETIGLKESKLVLGKHSGRHAFRDHMTNLGYNLTDEQIQQAFERFKVLADKKKEITDEDLRAIVEERLVETPVTFAMEYFQLSYGNQWIPNAAVRILRPDGEGTADGAAFGNGSVDAIYKAIDQATGEQVELVQYKINAVTEGTDALGGVDVRLRQGKLIASGRGVSTDILEASALAYLDALNRLVARRSNALNEEKQTATL
jgi:2-isopropylmalate synthase